MMENGWISAHLFYTGDHNQLLRLLVAPVIEKLDCPYFFIRYWENGPHVRLRLKVARDRRHIMQYLATAAADYFLRYPSPYSAAGGDAPHNNSLHYISYQPEISRYGDERSIHLAEQQFGISSAYVLKQITSPTWHTAKTLPEALKMNITLLYALSAPPLVTLTICRNFITAWLPRLRDQGSAVQLMEQRFNEFGDALRTSALSLWIELGRDGAGDDLIGFFHGTRQVFERYRAFGFSVQQQGDITGSLLHMGHNRIGVSNYDEAFMMYLTEKCLEHIYATT